MKLTIVVTLTFVVILLSSCCHNKKCNETIPELNYNYTGSQYQDNYVWGGAMNLAWNELSESIIKEPIKLATSDKAALITTDKLNNPVFSRKDMDEASYYIKSGYGQETVDQINQECRAKFPSKTIPDLLLKLGAKDIISYAYFLKEIRYQFAFGKQNITFMDKPVQGFMAKGDSYGNIYILDYKNEDNFLISIKLQDNADQIFLAKGYPMDKPDEVVKILREKAPLQKDKDYYLGSPMNQKDIFQAPVLHLNQERKYGEMIGNSLKNKNFTSYQIAVMQEVIKFDMDEKGARVENEAVIGMITSVGPNAYKPKKLILDKPYWVMMKRYDSNNPYFLLGVNNTELMKQELD